MTLVENVLRWLVAGAAGVVLAVLVVGVIQSHRKPHGRETGAAERMLRPWVEAVIGVAFFGVCTLLWRPVPLEPSGALRLGSDVLGAALATAGLALVLWGRVALGDLYGVSSSAGARLHADHRLITDGPFGYVRHPMYLGIEMTAVGGLLLYRTWTMVFLSVVFLGLIARARREDELLQLEFGDEWATYRRQVPGWLPRAGPVKRRP